MKELLTAAAIGVVGVMPVQAENIEIRANGSTPAMIGAADNFSG